MSAEAQNGRGKRKVKGADADDTEPPGPGTANDGLGSSAAHATANGAKPEPAAPKNERRARVKTAYMRLVTRARTLVSRIGYYHCYLHNLDSVSVKVAQVWILSVL